MSVNAFNAALNAALFVILMVVFTMFGRYIFRQIIFEGRTVASARIHAATSLAILVLGDAVLRGWFWYWRAILQGGSPDADYAWVNVIPVPTIGFLIQLVGSIFVIRVFSPDDWKKYTWVLVTMVAAVVGISVTFY